MGMYIEKHLEFRPFFWYFLREIVLHKRSNMLNLSQSHFGFRVIVCKEAPIHIFALCVASIITRNDAIRIDHWQNPKLKIFTKFVS